MKFIKIPNKEFETSVYQTTQGDWCETMPNNPAEFHGINNPVENVSWNNVQEFIKTLNKKNDGYIYRLPTEAEWEYCCRAGSTTDFCFGDSEKELKDYAWFWDNSDKKTHPVGEKKPNAFGLYDMHGNVWEWCEDEIYGSYRVLRGGSWNYGAPYLRSSNRINDSPGSSCSFVGFRLVRTSCIPVPSNTFTISKDELWRAYKRKARREFLKLWKDMGEK